MITSPFRPPRTPHLETRMTSLAIWMTAFTLGTCVTVIAAASGQHELLLGASAILALVMASVAIHDLRAQLAAGSNRSVIAAQASRHIGFVYIWAAATLLVVYGFVLTWRETWQFVAGLSVLGGLCIALAILFDKDAEAGREDEAMLNIARGLNAVQVVGMIATVIGLVVDNKFLPAMQGAPKVDWAANTIFFFGAIAIAAIGAFTIAHERDGKAIGR